MTPPFDELAEMRGAIIDLCRAVKRIADASGIDNADHSYVIEHADLCWRRVAEIDKRRRGIEAVIVAARKDGK
jgi:hypothetical protein